MDTFRNRRVTLVGIVAASTVFVASTPLAVEAEESILKRVVDVVSPRRAGGPVAGLRRRIEERPAHRNDYQDGLVVHAGGAYAGQFDSLEGHGGTNRAACRGGHCDDHCVVRPDRFGFYETQWRQWPGARVVQAASAEELTPESPPRLQLPEENEESLDPKAAVEFGVDEPVEDSDATTLPGLGPVVPPPRTPPPVPRPLPPARTPPPETKQEQPSERTIEEPEEQSAKEEKEAAPKQDAGQSPKPRTEQEPEPESKPAVKEPAAPRPPSTDDNLFDEAGHRRRLQERLAVIRSEARSAGTAVEPPTDAGRAKPGSEDTSIFLQPVPVESGKSPTTSGVRPVVYDREPSPAEANPMRTSRERGWRARLVEESRPVGEN